MHATWMYIGDPEGLAGMGLGTPLHVWCAFHGPSKVKILSAQVAHLYVFIVSLDQVGYIAMLLLKCSGLSSVWQHSRCMYREGP